MASLPTITFRYDAEARAFRLAIGRERAARLYRAGSPVYWDPGAGEYAIGKAEPITVTAEERRLLRPLCRSGPYGDMAIDMTRGPEQQGKSDFRQFQEGTIHQVAASMTITPDMLEPDWGPEDEERYAAAAGNREQEPSHPCRCPKEVWMNQGCQCGGT